MSTPQLSSGAVFRRFNMKLVCVRGFSLIVATAALGAFAQSTKAGCTITVTTSAWGDARDSAITLQEAAAIGRGSLTTCLTQAERDLIQNANFINNFGCPGQGASSRYGLNSVPPGPNCGAAYADDIVFANSATGLIHPSATIDLGANDDIDGRRPNGSLVTLEGPGSAGWIGSAIRASGDNSGNQLRNLNIFDFRGNAIEIHDPLGAILEGLVIGYNAGSGIWLGNGQSNHVPVNVRIGGTGVGQENLIFSNGGDGILMDMNNSFAPGIGAGNLIQNNHLGFSEDTGFEDQGNSGAGLRVINGDAPDVFANFIGRNGDAGIVFSNVEEGVIQGNRVGLPKGNDIARPNHQGIVLQAGTHNVQVGGSGVGQGNFVSGNTLRGIDVTGAGSDNNTIEGNDVSRSSAGLGAGNGECGITVTDQANNNHVRGNVIAGNAQWGVLLAGATNTTVENNTIGMREGSVSPNLFGGIRIGFGAATNTIGPNNHIGGNGGCGVLVEDFGTNANTIKGNLIGELLETPKPNGSGVCVIAGAVNTVIGGSTLADRNIISGNANDGVFITGADIVGTPGTGTNGTVIRGNYIGTNSIGTAALRNVGDGIELDAGAGSTQIIQNVISGNGGDGLKIKGANGSLVAANLIGLDATETISVPNGESGVSLFDGATNNNIGDPTLAACAFSANFILGNTGAGVFIGGTATQENTLACNYIGYAGYGNASGVRIHDGASHNHIRGAAIRGNGGMGVGITTGFANDIRETLIYGNGGLGIDLGEDGVTKNDDGDADSGANHRQNFPTIDNVVLSTTSATFQVSLNSIANRGYTAALFRSDRCGPSPSDYGEGQFILGTVALHTTSSGNSNVASLMFPVPNSATKNSYATAIATSDTGPDAGDSSEFGLCRGISDYIFKDGFEMVATPAPRPSAQALDEAEAAQSSDVTDLQLQGHAEALVQREVELSLLLSNTGAAPLAAPVLAISASAGVVVLDMHSSSEACVLQGRINCQLSTLKPGTTEQLIVRLSALDADALTLNVETELGGKVVGRREFPVVWQ
jgi:parallel beta-helix repeat protein